MDIRDVERDGRSAIEIPWEGSHDSDSACGRGWAALSPDGSLEGRIFFPMGDDSSF